MRKPGTILGCFMLSRCIRSHSHKSRQLVCLVTVVPIQKSTLAHLQDDLMEDVARLGRTPDDRDMLLDKPLLNIVHTHLLSDVKVRV